ncbi:MAG TPA: polysaccharide biosynthesis tyrosine autokinase [Bryobacteraceae bacterium]|nr:polysaccharide biosynthesis tyrosine autokinase [Bryobacteraceae bacterium]
MSNRKNSSQKRSSRIPQTGAVVRYRRPAPGPEAVFGSDRQAYEAGGFGGGEAGEFGSRQQAIAPPQILQTMWHGKRTIVLAALLVTLCAVIVTFRQTPIYQAHASLEVQDLNQDFLNLRETMPVAQSANQSALTDLQTQIQILQSDSLLVRVLDKLTKAPPSRTNPQVGTPGGAAPWANDARVKEAKNNLTVKTAGQTRIIDILFNSPDPAYAAAFVDTLAREFIEQNLEARFQMSERTGEWLQHQLREVRANLERSEDALQQYAQGAGLVFTSESDSVANHTLRQLQDELLRASADRVQRQSRLEMARASQPDALPEVANSSAMRQYQANLTDLKRQYAEAATVFTPQHTSVKRLQAQISTIESALAAEQRTIVDRINNEYQEAVRREKLLGEDYWTQSRKVTAEAEKSIQYNILKREVDTNRQLYQGMLQKIREAGIASAVRASNVRVLDAGRIPAKPYKPKLLVNAAIGFLTGAFLGAGLVMVREGAGKKLQAPGDATRYLNTRELGSIPSIETAVYGRIYSAVKGAFGGSARVLAGAESGGRGRVELVAWQQKKGMVTDSFRIARTSILFSSHRRNPRVLVFTSAMPAEGKTTVASNMAVVMAELGWKVLLIDADLRKPSLHKVFSLPVNEGLAEALADHQWPATALPQATAVPNLFVLPAGSCGAADPSTLLSSQRLTETIANYRRAFDMILFDTPPTLALADARIVARHADGVVLVLHAGETTSDAAAAAMELLAGDDTAVLGTILNAWNPGTGLTTYSEAYKQQRRAS